MTITPAPTRAAAAPARPSVTNDTFVALYRDQYRTVFRYALVLTRNPQDAEDVTAETFERALRAWSRGGVSSEAAVRWLFVTARRLAIDRWRRTRRALGARRRHRQGPNDALGESESWLWLDQVLRLLPPRQREVLALRYQRDLSDADIGLVMGLSESGVRSLAARAIATLRKHREVWE